MKDYLSSLEFEITVNKLYETMLGVEAIESLPTSREGKNTLLNYLLKDIDLEEEALIFA